MKYKTIQVCLGVGSNQLFPEYTTILIPETEEILFPEKLEKANNDLEKSKDSLPKKRGRKPKQK
jgi:hypothetical protein